MWALERLREATLRIIDAIGDDERFKLHILGHNGDNARIPLVGADTANDPATQLRVLETMVAHTQYTFPGDNHVRSNGASFECGARRRGCLGCF